MLRRSWTARRRVRWTTTTPGGSRRHTSTTADYVIVGAGSAGCVVAARLAEGGASVVVLEAGSRSPLYGPLSILCRMPTAFSLPMHVRSWNWAYRAAPSAQLNDRVVSCPRGRGLGGSSSINGMVYVRGHAMDYETWSRMGARGWEWPSVAAYFKKMENYDGPDDGTDLRGRDGPLHVSVGRNALGTDLFDRFIRAGDRAGYGPPFETTSDSDAGDYNGLRQEGVGLMPATVFHSGPRRGERCSTAAAYLEPAVRRFPHLVTVATDATAAQIVFSDAPKKATAVRTVDGRVFEASKEVVCCAGAVGTPHLLQLSGVGPAGRLEGLGIAPVADLQGVGANLMDHLEFYLQYSVADSPSLAPQLAPWRKLAIGARWVVARLLGGTALGLGATNHFEAGGFVRSRAGVEYPDVQFHFLPVAVSYDGVTVPETPTGHSFQLHVGANRSLSRGSVVAVSSDPRTAPAIDLRYMTHPADFEDMRAALRLARDLVAAMSPEASSSSSIHELAPGADATSDAAIDAFLREHLESAYHLCGTARMGADDDPTAVCDAAGAVRGVTGLRVCDASLFPSIPNGNLNAPTIMTAEKIADLILGNSPPPTPHTALAHPTGWIDPEWRTRQRVGHQQPAGSAAGGLPCASSSSETTTTTTSA